MYMYSPKGTLVPQPQQCSFSVMVQLPVIDWLDLEFYNTMQQCMNVLIHAVAATCCNGIIRESWFIGGVQQAMQYYSVS